MNISKDLEERLIRACNEYKAMVSVKGPDGTPGLLDSWTAEQYYEKLKENFETFRKDVIEHPFFAGKGYTTLSEIIDHEYTLFLYCLGVFLNVKFIGNFISTVELNGDNAIEVDPETMEPTNIEAQPTNIEAHIQEKEEKENRKEFVKEVLNGIPQKNTLRKFFEDPRSYKQFRDDVERCLLYTDWEMIHRVMKKLKWKWASWIDNEYNEHTNTVPSAFGIRENVSDLIKKMEGWIMNHPDAEEYFTSIGGFEIEMRIYDDEVDDYDHRVKFIVRFVVEQFDNGL